MNKLSKVFSLALSSLLALSLLAGCKNGDGEPTAARICFDNLGAGFLSEADTKVIVEGAESVSAVDADGNAVSDPDTVATYDEATGTVTAVSEGVLTLTLKGGDKFRVEVVPAYPTDPGNQYDGTALDYSQGGDLLGGCHDPSLIEVEEDGAPAYYIVSTGWAYGNEIRRSTDLLTWEYLGKTTEKDSIIPQKVEDWIGGTNDTGFVQWWAPDIVAAAGGGYWLYTCCVSNANVDLEGTQYSKACIILMESDTMEPGSFRYKGVLMQSCIPAGTLGLIDVNSIDPQIVYDSDGKMYMAYGSFGTGNWMLELDPKTGLRKDKMYKDDVFYSWQEVRAFRDDAVMYYNNYKSGEEISTEYYGHMISQGAMEAPVIARHDNVTVSDENGVIEEGKTYYYSMHSYNALAVAYQMWGGRSESAAGRYHGIGGSEVFNENAGASSNQGNMYMGSFTWEDKAADSKETNVVMTGHNDLFTTSSGLNVAAYITRTYDYHVVNALGEEDPVFMSQVHQYYLNSFGDLCINPNRYAGEIDRSVSKEELLHFTDGGRFKLVALYNSSNSYGKAVHSTEVVLTEDGKITQNGTQVGSWLMYGDGYIKIAFNSTNVLSGHSPVELVYYGVVRPAWLYEQGRSGFTVTAMSRSGIERNFALFMNGISTIGD